MSVGKKAIEDLQMLEKSKWKLIYTFKKYFPIISFSSFLNNYFFSLKLPTNYFAHSMEILMVLSTKLYKGKGTLYFNPLDNKLILFSKQRYGNKSWQRSTIKDFYKLTDVKNIMTS